MTTTSPAPTNIYQTQHRDPLDDPKSLLVARGRVMGLAESGSGLPYVKVNSPGNRIDGARLLHYDRRRHMVTVRVNHSTIPDFWLELELELDKLADWAEEQMDAESDGEEDGANDDSGGGAIMDA